MNEEKDMNKADYTNTTAQIISAYLTTKPEEFAQYLLNIGIAAEVPQEILRQLKAKK